MKTHSPKVNEIGWPWTEASIPDEQELDDPANAPAIALPMPSYNQDRFLDAAIRSVLLQNYPNLEFVVRDGGSTDESVDIIKSYEDKLTDWVSQPDGGQSAAINAVWDDASGELLGWLNSDDILAPGALHTLARAARDHPDVVLFFGDYGIIDEDGRLDRVRKVGDLGAEDLLRGKSFGQPSVFIRREVVENLGLLDESMTYSMDWAYFLKVLWSYPSSRIRYIPSVLSCSREYEGTKSRTGLEDKGEDRRGAIRRYADAGIIPNRDALVQKGLAGTYWVQGAEEFLAGQYVDAFRSGLNAIRLHPASLLEKIPRLIWLFRTRVERASE